MMMILMEMDKNKGQVRYNFLNLEEKELDQSVILTKIKIMTIKEVKVPIIIMHYNKNWIKRN